jgi:thioester reductase-like protein
MSTSPTVLVTGFPGFLASKVVPRLLRRDRTAELILVASPDQTAQARRLVGTLRGQRERVRLYSGDVGDMHFGLSGDEYRSLAEKVTEIYHLASANHGTTTPRVAERTHVEGTRHLIELAKDSPRLKRIHYLSTAFVCGDRQGVIDESELETGQRFRTPFEETRYRGEQIIRQHRTLPVTVYRPALLVGDAQKGEIDRLEGPCYFAIKLALAHPAVPLPLPQDADAPLNVAPWDYVVEALLTLAADERAIGGTFHLTDPNPLGTRRFYELLAERTGRRVQLLPITRGAAEAILSVPLLERVLRPQRAGFEHAYQLVFFRTGETERLIADKRVRCPPLPDYLDALIGYARDQASRRQEERVEDTLE